MKLIIIVKLYDNLGSAGLYRPRQASLKSDSRLFNHRTMVRNGYDLLSKHLDYALSHDYSFERATVFPSGEAELTPYSRSVTAVLPIGCNSAGAANVFPNSKTCFLTYKPVPFPATAISRRALQFYQPTADGQDILVPGSVNFPSRGLGNYSFTANNPAGTSSQVAKSRGVFTHITLAYQGQLSTATGSLYINIPQDGVFGTAFSSENSGMDFDSIFGESDIHPPGTIVSNQGVSHGRNKKYMITVAKLAELGSITFVIFNSLEADYILQKCQDTPTDILNENIGPSSTLEYVNFICFSDSTSLNDRLRVTVAHHFDIVYNNSYTTYHVPSHVTAPHIAPNHLHHVPEIINSQHISIPPTEYGASVRRQHAAEQVAHMAQGQVMEIGTLTNEEEFDVGHPSFGSVKKAAKAAWNTEQTDNEYYGAVVAGQPEVAAYAAPVVEPAIAAHAIYNFFRTNK